MPTSKLITRIKGGLGNQLFCYATARRLALANNAELVIDAVSGFAYDKQYKRKYALGAFNIHAEKVHLPKWKLPFNRVNRVLNKWLSRGKPLSRQRHIYQNSTEFNPGLMHLKLQPGTTYFDGFGQSERYFIDVEDVIRSDLTIEPPRDALNQAMAKKIQSTQAVALHVRWFEDAGAVSPNNVSAAYYAKAIERISKNLDAPHFFVFSDNAASTIDKLEAIMHGLAVTYVDINKSESMAFADMWLMSLCKHFIIANSTFGWWAAWLGEKKGISQVIAPATVIEASNNITAWGFDGQIPERWTLI
jgi:hypothetical protein